MSIPEQAPTRWLQRFRCASGGAGLRRRSTRIQYSQTVVLNFNGILWPHVSVATRIPGEPVSVPPPAWVIKRG